MRKNPRIIPENIRYITTIKKNNATINVYVNEEEPDEKEYMEGAIALLKLLLKD